MLTLTFSSVFLEIFLVLVYRIIFFPKHKHSHLLWKQQVYDSHTNTYGSSTGLHGFCDTKIYSNDMCDSKVTLTILKAKNENIKTFCALFINSVYSLVIDQLVKIHVKP